MSEEAGAWSLLRRRLLQLCRAERAERPMEEDA